MASSAAFRAKNAVGMSAEMRIANAFLLHKWSVCLPQVGSRWDLTVTLNNVGEHLEIKNEEEYEASGRICVELCQGKPQRKLSGLSISESTFYIHYFGEKSLILRTQPFKHFIDRLRGSEVVHEFRGSDNANCGYLIGRARFIGQPWAREVSLNDIPTAIAYLRQ